MTSPDRPDRPDQHPDPTSQAAVVSAAAAERRAAPVTDSEAADLADKYDRMMRLASLFDDSGEDMRQRSRLGTDLVADPAFAETETIAKPTHAQAEDDVLAATTGKRGLMSRSIELDADALVLRATVLTYRWIDELQLAAYETLGSIAGRAIGYLAPEVALGGAIVSAGLIETDALDRDGVAAYLNELTDSNPELMEHVASGGGGLLDGLRMRSLFTSGVLAGDDARVASRGGLRAIGLTAFPIAAEAGLRDVAGGLVEVPADPHDEPVVAPTGTAPTPQNLAGLMGELARTSAPVAVHRVGESRFIAYLTGPDGARPGSRLRLVGGDTSGYAVQVVREIERSVGEATDAHVMLVGAAAGGVTAAELASDRVSDHFTIDQVVTAGAPSAAVPRIPETTRVLSLEDRSDPVALLGSLINARTTNRVTVVYDGGTEVTDGGGSFVAGGRAADNATHEELRAEIARIQQLGYLAG